MITTKDIWLTLSEEKKLEHISEALSQLEQIQNKTNPLQVKADPTQGRLSNVKKDLEKFIIDAISWESDRQIARGY